MILTMASPPQMRTRPAISINYDFRRSSGSSASDILMRVYRNFNPLADTLCNVMDLLTLEERWNGYDAARPNARSVEHAHMWITQLYDEVRASSLWLKPHVTADAYGDVVFEWWKDERKLTVYVSPDAAEYVKVWGPDIDSQMDDGVVSSEADRRALWHWFVGQADFAQVLRAA